MPPSINVQALPTPVIWVAELADVELLATEEGGELLTEDGENILIE